MKPYSKSHVKPRLKPLGSPALRALRSLCCSLALVAVAACEEDPVLAPSAVVGTYAATAFTTTTGGTTRDVIADGGSILLTLSGAGLTDGSLTIPPSGDQGVVIANLAGTWSLVGNSVELDHPNDTFLRDMPLRFTGNTLVGDQTFSGTRVQVTLTRE